MNATQKHIYNTYQLIQRQGKPYNFRKDFTNLDEITQTHLAKLQYFFEQFSHIDIVEFFQAPFKLYQDSAHYELQFYLSPKAINYYKLFKEQKYLNVDCIDNLNDITRSLKFVKQYCQDHNLKLSQYCDNSSRISPIFDHIKTYRVNKCVAVVASGITQNIEKEIVEIILGDFFTELSHLRAKVYASKQCRKLLESGWKLVENQL